MLLCNNIVNTENEFVSNIRYFRAVGQCDSAPSIPLFEFFYCLQI